MDVQMPIMDGFTATNIIREQLELTHLPILAMTAGVTEFEREQCIASGMNDLIAKPIDVEQMLCTISDYLPADQLLAPAPVSDKAVGERQSEGIFNVDRLLQLTAGNDGQEDKTRQLIANLLDSCAANLEKIRAAYQAQDYSLLSRLLHSMRGSLGTLGASRFADAARELELALPNVSPADLAEGIQRVESELQMTVSLGRAWLNQPNSQL
jgi:CheY-like chemotaxis protein